MSKPGKIQVSEALVKLACASGMLKAFAEENAGTDLGELVADQRKDLDEAREILRLATGGE